MSRTRFGTDGIRGKVGQPPFTPAHMARIAVGLGGWVRSQRRPHLIAIGRDTRASGEWIEALLTASLSSLGIDVIRLGVLATPAIASGTRAHGATLGIAVTASHNPYTDNGLKLFGPEGFKLSAQAESEVEAAIGRDELPALPERPGHVAPGERTQAYFDTLFRSLPSAAAPLDGLHVVVDCANGAASDYAPGMLERCGARVDAICNRPDGLNINTGCGATHLDVLSSEVVKRGAYAGIALDGDGDRLIMVDETGRAVDGDQLIALLARAMLGRGRLKGSGVVATVMSNLGLETYLADLDVHLVRTAVGDRNVVQAMRAGGYVLGGEQSGHMILADYATTGDGLLCALHVLAIARIEDRLFSEVAHVFEPVPQQLVNVHYEDGDPLAHDSVKSVIEDVSRRLDGGGRVLVRKSGTEPLIRIMAESTDAAAMKAAIAEIETAIHDAIKAGD